MIYWNILYVLIIVADAHVDVSRHPYTPEMSPRNDGRGGASLCLRPVAPTTTSDWSLNHMPSSRARGAEALRGSKRRWRGGLSSTWRLLFGPTRTIIITIIIITIIIITIIIIIIIIITIIIIIIIIIIILIYNIIIISMIPVEQHGHSGQLHRSTIAYHVVTTVRHAGVQRWCRRRAELSREVRRESRQVHFAGAHVVLDFDRAVHLLVRTVCASELVRWTLLKLFRPKKKS